MDLETAKDIVEDENALAEQRGAAYIWIIDYLETNGGAGTAYHTQHMDQCLAIIKGLTAELNTLLEEQTLTSADQQMKILLERALPLLPQSQLRHEIMQIVR